MRKLLTLAILIQPMNLAAQDHPLITRPATSMADIIALADLDGDPHVISDDEFEMIALLSQLLGAQPVQN